MRRAIKSESDRNVVWWDVDKFGRGVEGSETVEPKRAGAPRPDRALYAGVRRAMPVRRLSLPRVVIGAMISGLIGGGLGGLIVSLAT